MSQLSKVSLGPVPRGPFLSVHASLFRSLAISSNSQNYFWICRILYMQPSTPPHPTPTPFLVLIYLMVPFFFFLQPLLPTSLPPPPHFTFLAPPLSSASSSFCLLRWRKKKAPSRSLQQFRMAFISRYIAPSSSSAPLRRQRASKVLRYCHLQFSFYLRFFNSATPRGAVHTTWATSFVCFCFFCCNFSLSRFHL